MSVQSELLKEISHRPFPLPTTPWVLSQSWSNLLFAHWPIAKDLLRPLIPDCLEIDMFEGEAWIGVVPFAMRDVVPRHFPKISWLSNFLELNVRTYVIKDGIPGVYFFSLDCSNPVAVWVAKNVYHLPYFNAEMSMKQNADGCVVYTSQRKKSSARFTATYRPISERIVCVVNSIETFLTERYCLYTTDRKGTLYRGTIHHLVWPLQLAEADIDASPMTQAELGFALPDTQPLLHYSERIDTIEWALTPII